jgi:D-xylose transport system ATP-binding protein
MLITHVMAQAFQVADRIVVLRHGSVAGDVATDATSPDEVVRMITGDIGRISSRRATVEAGRNA